jgi:hypothetical protein
MWIIGHAHLITWSSDDFYYIDVNDVPQPDSVKLEISHDGGSNWDTIEVDIPNSGSYSWVVTGPACADAVLRFSGVHNTDVTADSTEFSIVAEVFTSASVAPFIGSVSPEGTLQFTATGLDQNGEALVDQPTDWVWDVSGGGTIGAATGLFTAGAVEGGPFDVTAISGGITGEASVTVRLMVGQNSMVMGMGMFI